MFASSHPPKVPHSFDDIHPFLVPRCAVSFFFVCFTPVVSISIAGEKAPKCPSLAPKRFWPGFGPKGPSPKVSRSKCQEPGGKPQSAQVWLQKAPGQDLAQKGHLPRFPEANFNTQLASPKLPKSDKCDVSVGPENQRC